MLQPRPTAQQAIEVLKVHQLRKENVIILEEIKRLRSEVTSRTNELNDALKQVADLQARLKQAADNTVGCNRKIEALNLSSELTNVSLEVLRQGVVAARDDFTKKIEVQQMNDQKADVTIKALREDIVQLRKQIENADNRTGVVIDRINHDLSTKAEQQAVSELEDRMDQILQRLESRLETHKSVSRVSDTAEELMGQDPDRHLPGTHRYEEGMWKRNDCAFDAQLTVQQSPSIVVRHIAEENAEDHLPTFTPLHSEVTPTRRMISNIHHGTVSQEEEVAHVVQPKNAHQQAVSEQLLKQQGIRLVPTEHRSAPVVFPTAQAQISHSHTNPETMRQALRAILELAQAGTESLARYLAHFRALLTRVGTCDGVVEICLRWFLAGLPESEERRCIEKWLRTSDCPLRVIQDCIIVLTQCWSSTTLNPPDRSVQIDPPMVDSATIANETVPSVPISPDNVERIKLDQDSLSHEEALGEAHSPSEGHLYTQESRPDSSVRESLDLNVATESAAAIQPDAQAGADEESQSRTLGRDAYPKRVTNNGTGKAEKRHSHAEAPKQTNVANVVKSIRATAPAQKAVTSQTPNVASKIPKMLAELSEFNRSPSPRNVIENTVEANQLPIKERGACDPPQQSDEACMPSTPPIKALPSPRTPVPQAPKPGGGKLSRLPTLVGPMRARSAVSEASDPVSLPPVQRQKRRGGKQPMKVDQPRKRRRLREDTPPDIPILTLTPSDFNRQEEN